MLWSQFDQTELGLLARLVRVGLLVLLGLLVGPLALSPCIAGVIGMLCQSTEAAHLLF